MLWLVPLVPIVVGVLIATLGARSSSSLGVLAGGVVSGTLVLTGLGGVHAWSAMVTWSDAIR